VCLNVRRDTCNCEWLVRPMLSSPRKIGSLKRLARLRPTSTREDVGGEKHKEVCSFEVAFILLDLPFSFPHKKYFDGRRRFVARDCQESVFGRRCYGWWSTLCWTLWSYFAEFDTRLSLQLLQPGTLQQARELPLLLEETGRLRVGHSSHGIHYRRPRPSPRSR
jgi:hypothetical protein